MCCVFRFTWQKTPAKKLSRGSLQVASLEHSRCLGEHFEEHAKKRRACPPVGFCLLEISHALSSWVELRGESRNQVTKSPRMPNIARPICRVRAEALQAAENTRTEAGWQSGSVSDIFAISGVRRTGSASDSRSGYWEFESLCPHLV